MNLTYHGAVQFLGRSERPSLAYLRVYQSPRGDRPALAVVSADPRNLGECPFAFAEEVLAAVCLTLGLDADCVWWVEHHSPVPGHEYHPLGSDRYYLVEFGTDGLTPRRRVVGRAARTLCDVERLAGGVLAPPKMSIPGGKGVRP